jgi:hypothetical protein
MSWPDGRLIEERVPCRFDAEQFHERIVERQGPIPAGRGKVDSLSFAHCLKVPSVAIEHLFYTGHDPFADSLFVMFIMFFRPQEGQYNAGPVVPYRPNGR